MVEGPLMIGGGVLTLSFGGIFLYFLVPEIVANLAAVRWTRSACRILSRSVRSEESIDVYSSDTRLTS
jgi:hypothetical protein